MKVSISRWAPALCLVLGSSCTAPPDSTLVPAPQPLGTTASVDEVSPEELVMTLDVDEANSFLALVGQRSQLSDDLVALERLIGEKSAALARVRNSLKQEFSVDEDPGLVFRPSEKKILRSSEDSESVVFEFKSDGSIRRFAVMLEGRDRLVNEIATLKRLSAQKNAQLLSVKGRLQNEFLITDSERFRYDQTSRELFRKTEQVSDQSGESGSASS